MSPWVVSGITGGECPPLTDSTPPGSKKNKNAFSRSKHWRHKLSAASAPSTAPKWKTFACRGTAARRFDPENWDRGEASLAQNGATLTFGTLGKTDENGIHADLYGRTTGSNCMPDFAPAGRIPAARYFVLCSVTPTKQCRG